MAATRAAILFDVEASGSKLTGETVH